MRIPKSWNDRGLFEDEPFLTQFLVLSHGGGTRSSGGANANHIRNVSNAVLGVVGGPEAVQAWAKIAFHPHVPDNYNVQIRTLAVQESAETFVKVFWLIYAGREEEAFAFLNGERKRMGLIYRLCTTPEFKWRSILSPVNGTKGVSPSVPAKRKWWGSNLKNNIDVSQSLPHTGADRRVVNDTPAISSPSPPTNGISVAPCEPEEDGELKDLNTFLTASHLSLGDESRDIPVPLRDPPIQDSVGKMVCAPPPMLKDHFLPPPTSGYRIEPYSSCIGRFDTARKTTEQDVMKYYENYSMTNHIPAGLSQDRNTTAKDPRTCFRCGELGHIQRNCLQNYREVEYSSVHFLVRDVSRESHRRGSTLRNYDPHGRSRPQHHNPPSVSRPSVPATSYGFHDRYRQTPCGNYGLTFPPSSVGPRIPPVDLIKELKDTPIPSDAPLISTEERETEPPIERRAVLGKPKENLEQMKSLLSSLNSLATKRGLPPPRQGPRVPLSQMKFNKVKGCLTSKQSPLPSSCTPGPNPDKPVQLQAIEPTSPSETDIITQSEHSKIEKSQGFGQRGRPVDLPRFTADSSDLAHKQSRSKGRANHQEPEGRANKRHRSRTDLSGNELHRVVSPSEANQPRRSASCGKEAPEPHRAEPPKTQRQPSDDDDGDYDGDDAPCPRNEVDCRLSDLLRSASPFNDVKPTRPPLPKLPPIWSQSRQELCESFELFKSYQSGVYHYSGIAKGYLLSAFASRRDIFCHDGKLIISHGGGKSESLHTRNRQVMTQLADDQLAEDKSVHALLTTYRSLRPLVLLIDDRYSLFPYDLAAKDVTYAVLGYFFISHAWAEYTPANNSRGRVVRYKFAFQWCDEQGDPWWIPGGAVKRCDPSPDLTVSSVNPSALSSFLQPDRPIPGKTKTVSISQRRPLKLPELYLECGDCNEWTPQVYSHGWMCLNPKCSLFWTSKSGCPPPDNLDYTEDFLKLQPTPLLLGSLQDLKPHPPATRSGSVTTNYAFTRGWHCKRCGRLSSRFKWEYWECRHCGATLKVTGKIQNSQDLMVQAPNVSFSSHLILDPGIKCSAAIMLAENLAEVQCYTLPYDRGKIYHIRGTPRGNKEADQILLAYQEQAETGELQFRRWPLKTHKLRGPLLANYFSQNSGEPYQYIGGSDRTVPFESAPGAVIRALKLIQDRVAQVLGVWTDFNEILSAAYMERQRMAFHSDNEKGLGPLVAGLSLGSPALMHFRLVARYLEPNERRSNAITFVLRHGDILVMDGENVQKFYEHTVAPINFRIAATARWISPQSQ